MDNSGQERNPPLSPEIKVDMPVAEDIARYRIQMERVFGDPAIPSSQWEDASKLALDEYPRLTPYGQLISSALDVAVSTNHRINEVWGIYGRSEGSFGDTRYIRDYAADHFLSEFLGIHIPRSRFEALLKNPNMFPVLPITVVKGPVSIEINLDGETYREFENSKNMRGTRALTFVKDRIPVTVHDGQELDFHGWPDFKRKQSIDVQHELEHAKNHVLEDALMQFAISTAVESINQGSLQQTEASYEIPDKRIEDLIDDPFRKVQDEISGAFTIMEFFSPNTSEVASTDVKLLIKNIFGVGDEKELPVFTPSISSAYQSLGKERFKRIVDKSIDAIFEMQEHYVAQGDEQPSRMAINVLMQFPLEKWPAVVRLFKSRSNSTTDAS